MPSSGGANADCLELYKESKKFLAQVQKTVSKLESGLLDLINTKSRQEALLSPTNVGKLKALHDIEPFMESVQGSLSKINDLELSFFDIARDEKSCRKTYFFRVRYIVTSLERQKLTLLYLLQQYVLSMLNLVSARQVDMAQAGSDWLYVLQSADNFNKLLVDNGMDFSESPLKNTLIHSHFNKDAHIHENFFPSYPMHLKQFTTSKILQTVASQRSWFAATEVTRSIVVGLDKRQLEMASNDVSWLSVPQHSSTTEKADPSLDIPPVLQMAVHGAKNKDGNGNKRKNRNNNLLNGDSPTSDYHSQNGGHQNHFQIIEDFVSHEENFLGHFFQTLAQVPGLLGKNVLKIAKAGEGIMGERIHRTARVKMSEYYHDLLWTSVGSLAEKILLWSDIQDIIYVPFGLQDVRICLGLSNLLQDNLYAKFGDGYPPIVFPCIHLLVESLNLHCISASWDLQFMGCLSESSRSKTVALTAPTTRSGTLVSKTGKLFYDTLKSIVRLNNRTHPDMIRDFVEHGSFDPEEFPFQEEISVLRRLSATLFCLRNWANSRAHSTLHTWQVQDFLLITQCDLLNMEDCFGILQMESHERNAHTRSINIQLFTHVQKLVCDEIHECQSSIRALPKENQGRLSEVCRTYSLATLQNIFPSERHWRQTGPLANKSSNYVNNFIERVLSPVFKSLEFMKIEIQQTIARLTVKSFCEAWLEHIKSSRIKFSDCGAHQISLDFQGLRTWIVANPYLKEDSRRYVLLLDSIRQCEGVAKLLQSKPGEVVDVKSTKNRVTPISENGTLNNNHHANHTQRQLSPVNQILDSIPAELYVPNQQQWVKLKTGTKLSLPFCCR